MAGEYRMRWFISFFKRLKTIKKGKQHVDNIKEQEHQMRMPTVDCGVFDRR